MPPRPETPTTNKPYPKGTICRLRIAVKGKLVNPPPSLWGAYYDAPKGSLVRIQDVSALVNTGSTEPLTAANAGYRVHWTTTIPAVVQNGDPIDSGRVRHSALSTRVGGGPSIDLHRKGTVVYLTQAFNYNFRGSHTLPVGTQVIIAEPATTFTGRTPYYSIRPNDACYSVALTMVENRSYEVSNPSGHLLYHDSLALP
ncbi:hypothetical protein Hypma_014695 [Hypsizygus marmoreus]|uniref:Uncharacterized protein n=1 Tax=Hypsizygus marmoreus TaxID=39966 RepID=A0A369J9C7_HYPMA|nr:hypothetical protein Hypma_014695 [Hypsizygus marmoreus]